MSYFDGKFIFCTSETFGQCWESYDFQGFKCPAKYLFLIGVLGYVRVFVGGKNVSE